ncbi:glutaredoxin 2 [Acinetobacter sp. B5B]|uniref:glutaredoxin 2 n=1 Tax=Acinetobacter baretiae TaxID=2605383 RepID=UPI0018C28BF5|nr:glutaredoxin 2 [Acinetobacter baretiae]MBF7682108.1 glutaredoxin 2 [Acinetobacter baretiae]MBF7684650.1 glutaredoxin 2 [Acinetobacter baretiae]
MKAYIYEHCPFCLRVRMIAGFKNLPMQYAVIMEGDAETPIQLVGKKVVPILQREDGQHMTESLEIVKYLDGLGEPKYAQEVINTELKTWVDNHLKLVMKLIVPRFVRVDFTEISTSIARQAFIERETQVFGSLDALFEQSDIYIPLMNKQLAALDQLIVKHKEIDLTDFILFPWLRSLSVVEGLQFAPQTLRYMNRIATAAKVPLLFDQAI